MIKIFAVVPVFKEYNQVVKYIACWKKIKGYDTTVFIVNGNPGDETSELLKKKDDKIKILEIPGNSNLFWSGLVELGLRKIAEIAEKEDLIVLSNIDIEFEQTAVDNLICKAAHDRVVSAVSVGKNGVCLSSGVIIKNWHLSLTKHVFRDYDASNIITDLDVLVDFLPTRFIAFSPEVLLEVGYPNSEKLPHYSADYEYTHRMKKNGYKLLVVSDSFIHNDTDNTGFHAGYGNSILDRFKVLSSIKSPNNLRYRFWFVILVYPKYAKVTGLLSTYCKIFINIIMGQR